MFDRNNFRFDPRLSGIDQNGNPIRGKKKKKKRTTSLDELKRRYAEENYDEEVEYKFSLNGLIPVYPEKTHHVTKDEDVEETQTFADKRRGNDRRNDKHDKNNNKHQQQKPTNVDDAIEKLEDFVDMYSSNKMNTGLVKELISAGFAEIANIMTNYENPKYEKAVPAMNKMIILMSTDNFSKMFHVVLKEGTLIHKENTRDDMMRLFNLVLDAHSDKLSSDVMSTYVDIIADIIADLDIKIMMDTYGMSEDVALDFIVTIPVSVIGVKSDSDIKAYARKFINVVLTDYEETSRYMNAEMQKKVFYSFFNDKRDTGAIKAAGQCLSANQINLATDNGGNANELQSVLLDHYKQMLYDVLEEHDIPTIKIPLKFIVKEMRYRAERNIDTPIVFNVNDVLDGDYPNIQKAIVDLCEHDSLAAEMLSIDAE